MEFTASELDFPMRFQDAILDFWRTEYPGKTEKIVNGIRFGVLELHVMSGDTWWILRNTKGGFPSVAIDRIPDWDCIVHTVLEAQKFFGFMDSVKSKLKAFTERI